MSQYHFKKLIVFNTHICIIITDVHHDFSFHQRTRKCRHNMYTSAYFDKLFCENIEKSLTNNKESVKTSSWSKDFLKFSKNEATNSNKIKRTKEVSLRSEDLEISKVILRARIKSERREILSERSGEDVFLDSLRRDFQATGSQNSREIHWYLRLEISFEI